MANTTFDGPVRSRNGFQTIGPDAIDANTLATNMTVAANAGRIMLMDAATTPTAITIPAIISTADGANSGPGSDPNNASTIGTTFEIVFTDEFTGTIQTANTDDKFIGIITAGITASTAGKQWVPAATNNEINLNGEAGAAVATTGGLKGTYLKFTAVAANLYLVQGLTNATGTLATPFDDQ